METSSALIRFLCRFVEGAGEANRRRRTPTNSSKSSSVDPKVSSVGWVESMGVTEAEEELEAPIAAPIVVDC
jgi:hypothetical protein